MRLADDLATLDAGLGMSTLKPGAIGDFLPLLTRDLSALPAGHTISNGSRPEKGVPHYAWIALGSETSADLMYFTGVTSRLHSSWPDRISGAGRDSDAQKAVAALTAGIAAHEGRHASLSRSEPHPKGEKFPSGLDEARTELANALSDDSLILTRAMGMDDEAARNNQLKPLSDRSYADRVTWLDSRLDAIGVSKQPEARRKFIEETSIWTMRDLVGEPAK
jgi:hypothetical protein